MAYFADLSPYRFLHSESANTQLNVGWLSRWHRFPRGAVPDEVLGKIFRLCQQPVNRTRGFHACEFCRRNSFGQLVERDGISLRLGSAEIWAPGRPGVEYACPDLIYHYMKDHNYKPPQEFIDAVLKLP